MISFLISYQSLCRSQSATGSELLQSSCPFVTLNLPTNLPLLLVGRTSNLLLLLANLPIWRPNLPQLDAPPENKAKAKKRKIEAGKVYARRLPIYNMGLLPTRGSLRAFRKRVTMSGYI